MMNLLELQESPEAFRAALLIDTDSGPRQLSECLSANAWQRQDFEQLDSGWKRAIGQAVEGPCYSRAFLERPRGHSKTLGRCSHRGGGCRLSDVLPTRIKRAS